MRTICAIIRPHRLRQVTNALSDVGGVGFASMEVCGAGQRMKAEDLLRNADSGVGSVSDLKIEAAVPDNRYEEALMALRRAVGTGAAGGGDVFVYFLGASACMGAGDKTGGV